MGLLPVRSGIQRIALAAGLAGNSLQIIHQRLAEGSSIPEIAAGKRNHIRRLPSELLQHFENDCLLTFDSEGID